MQPSDQQNTAVLVFANSSTEELRHKPIGHGKPLFDALTTHTLSVVAKSKLPYFLITEKQQLGDSFGERFTNAIKLVLDKGFANVITVGNDSPQLQTAHILEANKQLGRNQFVLGPTTDGGFYLMGIQKSHFNPIDFKKFSWQTSLVGKQLVLCISKLTDRVFQLPVLQDIDTIADIKTIISYAFRIPKKLLFIFLHIIEQETKRYYESAKIVLPSFAPIFYNKGSPLVH